MATKQTRSRTTAYRSAQAGAGMKRVDWSIPAAHADQIKRMAAGTDRTVPAQARHVIGAGLALYSNKKPSAEILALAAAIVDRYKK